MMKKISILANLAIIACFCLNGCDHDNVIYINPSCTDSSDCDDGEICKEGSCVEKKNSDDVDDDTGCKSNDDCNAGYVCKKGVCSKNTVKDEDSCADKKKNGDETDIDCGGSCEKCADGKVCEIDADCESDFCDNGLCSIKVDLCADGVLSGDESDVDCGGSCEKCADGMTCSSENDCSSGFCDGSVCTSCSDGALNGDETDVDCGGRCGATCGVEKICRSDNDCEYYNCVNGICADIDCKDSAEAGDIIINEVFSNPNTDAKMEHSNNKQLKYIELYNTTDKALQLYNLSLTFEGNEIQLKGSIPAKTYLIVHQAGQNLTALDIDAKQLDSDNIDTAVNAVSGSVKLVKRADGTVVHSVIVPETEKGTAAGRDKDEASNSIDEQLVPHSSVKTIENGVKNLYSPGLPNNSGFPMG